MKDRVLLGTLRRRAIYFPTWRGWLLALGLLVLGAWFFFRQVHGYLAKDDRLPKAEVLVVEGWVSDKTLEMAVQQWREGRCLVLCTAGVDIEKGSMFKEFKNWADLTAESLIKLGLPQEKVLSAPAGASQRHRTYSGAAAAKQVLEEKGIAHATINVLTEGAHSRRTGLVFRKVFGPGVEIGFLPVPSDEYDPDAWWKSSAGVKAVLMETMAVVYERLANSGRN